MSIWFANEKVTGIPRNVLLGLLGMLIGGSGLIWSGYAFEGASAQSPAPPPANAIPPAVTNLNTLNFNGTNNGVVTTGPIGTVTIDQDPRRWNLSADQVVRVTNALTSSSARGRVYIRLNDPLARNFRDQVIQIIQSIPGWEAYNQGDGMIGTLGDVRGIMIDYQDGPKPPPIAQALIAAFSSAALQPPPGHSSVPAWTNAEVRIVIGSPP